MEVCWITPELDLLPLFDFPVTVPLYGYQFENFQLLMLEYYIRLVHTFDTSDPAQPSWLTTYEFNSHPLGGFGVGGFRFPPL